MVNVLLYLLVLCGANQFEPQIGPLSHYATLYKTIYSQPRIRYNQSQIKLFRVLHYGVIPSPHVLCLKSPTGLIFLCLGHM